MNQVAIVWWGAMPDGVAASEVAALGRELGARACTVTVLTVRPEVRRCVFGIPVEDSVAASAHEVVHVPWRPERRWQLVNDWPAAPVKWPRARQDGTTGVGRESATEPELGSWAAPATSTIQTVLDGTGVGLVIAIGPPYVAFEAAIDGCRGRNVPLVLYDWGEVARPTRRDHGETVTEYWVSPTSRATDGASASVELAAGLHSIASATVAAERAAVLLQ